MVQCEPQHLGQDIICALAEGAFTIARGGISLLQ
jgi:hypothetical protein